MNFSEIPSPAATPAPTPTPDVKAPVKTEAVAATPEAKPAEGTPAAEAKAEPKIFKLNVKGKEVELTEEQAISLLQKAQYADQQIKEAVQTKKAVASLVERLKANPWEVLQDPAIGLDVKKLAVEKIKEMMADEQKDPKERELEMTRKELEAYRKKEEEARIAAENNKKQAEIKAKADEFRKEMIDVIEAHKDVLPKSQAVMDRLIGYMRAGYKKTGKVLPASEAIKYVLNDYKAEVSEMFKTADVTKLVDMFGPDVIEKLRKADLAKLQKINEASLKGDKKESKTEIPVNKKGRIPEKQYEKFWKDRIAGL